MISAATSGRLGQQRPGASSSGLRRCRGEHIAALKQHAARAHTSRKAFQLSRCAARRRGGAPRPAHAARVNIPRLTHTAQRTPATVQPPRLGVPPRMPGLDDARETLQWPATPRCLPPPLSEGAPRPGPGGGEGFKTPPALSSVAGAFLGPLPLGCTAPFSSYRVRTPS